MIIDFDLNLKYYNYIHIYCDIKMNYNDCDEMCCEMISLGWLDNNWVCFTSIMKYYKYFSIT